jgi:predicted nicotinamide N-methyase
MSFPLQLKTFHFAKHYVEIFVPESTALQQSYQQGEIAFPFWSQVWPAAKALTQFILQNLDYVLQKKIVELGAGLGLPSMAAARFAASVLCSDISEEAIEAATKSAAHNHLNNLTVSLLDWNYLPANLEADVLLLSDVNYEPQIFLLLQKLIKDFLQKNTTVILSTPQRLMAKEFMIPLINFCKHQEDRIIIHEEKEVTVTIFVLKSGNS